MPVGLICVPVLYLVLLGASAWAIHESKVFDILGVAVPLAAIWFGALGGVVSSLQGMFFHRLTWDAKFTLWHVFSGIVGAAYGIVSFLFLVVIMKAGTSDSPNLDAPIFALSAFAIGYAQSHFHSMMEKVFTVVFSEQKKPESGGKEDGGRNR